jgi:hypothetical protein
VRYSNGTLGGSRLRLFSKALLAANALPKTHLVLPTELPVLPVRNAVLSVGTVAPTPHWKTKFPLGGR